MTTPSEEEARAAAEKAIPPSEWTTKATLEAFRETFIKGYLAALASRVSTPPSENGSCWDEGPTLPVRVGECAPMPPLCELRAGHLGAHRGPRSQHGLATEWMTRPPATPPTEDRS